MPVVQFILMLLVYSLMCAFVGWRVGRLLPSRRSRWIWAIAVVLMSASFFGGFALRGTFVGMLMRKAGILWMVTLSYWLVAVLVCELIGWINRRRRFLPNWMSAKPKRAGRIAAGLSILVVAGIFYCGHLRALEPRLTVKQIEINKAAGSLKSLRVAVATDLHMGEEVNRRILARFVDRINALEADIILLPGDMVDNDVDFVKDDEDGEELKRLRAKYGVWGVTGNHERYAGANAAVAFLEESGVRMLRDRTVMIGNSFYLAGWDDASKVSLDSFLKGIDKRLPVILMNHQPKPKLMDQAEAAGVDLFLAGHTHGGQIWPATWIVKYMWEISYGLKQRGDMYVYVSSGMGLWGLPVRLGSEAEVVLLELRFTGE